MGPVQSAVSRTYTAFGSGRQRTTAGDIVRQG